LANRGLLHPQAWHYVFGCGQVEDARHLFLSCSFTASLWPLLRLWIGFEVAGHQSISDHFIQFIFSIGGLESRRSFLQLIWLLATWILWNERNNRLFNNKECNILQLLDEVKYYSLWWLKAKKATFGFGDHLCWTSPLSSLGIG
jgi:hypothetical protein